MEQIAAFIGQLIWQAQQGLAGIGWNAGELWDRMGDTWHRVLAVILLFVLFFLLGGLVATIGRYCEVRQAEREQPEEDEQPRADTGALLLAQMAVEASQAIETAEDDAGEDFETYFLSFNAQQPDVKFTRKQALAMYYRLPLYAEWRDAERSGIGTVLASDFIPWFEAPKQEERGEQA